MASFLWLHLIRCISTRIGVGTRSHMVTHIKIWGHSREGRLFGQLRNSQRVGSSGHSVALVNEKLARSAQVQEHSRESLQLPNSFKRKCSESSDGGKICPADRAVQASVPTPPLPLWLPGFLPCFCWLNLLEQSLLNSSSSQISLDVRASGPHLC